MSRLRGCQRCRDFLEAWSGIGGREVRHRAKELVTSVADEHVVRADVGPWRLADEPKQCVAGQVAMGVIHLFEPVDVDEGDHKLRADAMRALELVRNLCKTERPRPCTSQFVGRRDRQRIRSFRTTVTCLRAFSRCLCAVVGRAPTVVRCLGPICRRPKSIALRPQQDIVVTRPASS